MITFKVYIFPVKAPRWAKAKDEFYFVAMSSGSRGCVMQAAARKTKASAKQSFIAFANELGIPRENYLFIS